VKRFLKFAAIVIALLIIGLVATTTLLLDEEFKAKGEQVSNCPGSMFTKSAVVFDTLLICATRRVPNEKLQHAANVAAEWLDNDGDGEADEPRVVAAVKDQKALVMMSFEGFSNAAMMRLMPDIQSGGYTGQDLYASAS